ncbi:MAG: amino acid ABC transporter substrate-binding protein [Rhodospirillales bacterium]|jgi:polar amino acid transport system substrate-binding protein|nr:amino acid ABC transporter substrate-binding protein [Rhodospirillales bacterium]
MLKKIAAIAAGVAVVATMNSQAVAKTLINGIDANFPPFAYVDKSGKPSGFDVDAVDWIAKKMGFEVTHQPVAWEGIIPNLVAKKIDFICSGMTITAERAKIVNFTTPYWEHRNQFVAKKDSSITEQKILTGGITLGVQQGTSELKWLQKTMKEKGWNFKFRMYDSAPMAVEDVLNGRIEAAAMNDAPAKDAVEKKPVKIVAAFGDVDAYGCATRKADTDLKKKLDDGYIALRKDPYWKELLNKYEP